MQGGNELCRIEGFDRGKAVSELKVSIEAEAGLALMRLINPESHVELQDHLTLKDAGMPSEHALAEGVIQLYAQKLKKVVVADELQIAQHRAVRGEVTDSELAVFCDSIRDDPPDILVFGGCRGITNLSCLVQLSTISHLDISGCNLGAKGGFHLADVIKDMGALLVLSLKDNKLATKEGGKALAQALASNSTLKELDVSSNTWKENGNPRGDGPGFVQELAVGIKDNGALTSLNLANSNLGQLVLPVGWTKEWMCEKFGGDGYKHIDGREQKEDPSRPEGIIALASAIKDMGAISLVGLSGNGLERKGALAICDAFLCRYCVFWYCTH
jgi:hypothetical protein